MVWEIPAINRLWAKLTPLQRLASLFLLAAFPFFFVGGPEGHSLPVVDAIWNGGHLAFFAALVIVARAFFALDTWRHWLWLSAAVFVGGSAIEVIQYFIGRDSDWVDVLRDLTGAWVSLFWLLPARRLVWAGRVLAVGLALPHLGVVVWAGWAQLHAQQQFPLLADFEQPVELHGIKGQVERSRDIHAHGHYSLRVHITTERYSGVIFNEFFNSWAGYSHLRFDLYNPSPEPIVLTLRINDVLHEARGNVLNDRFNKTLLFLPGWNQVDIPVSDILNAPATRQMNLQAIESLMIYALQLPKARDIYLDNLRLE